MKLVAAIVVAFFAVNLTHAADVPAPANTPPAVQVDVSKILNARAVTTLTDGKVVPLQTGIAGSEGMATQAAAVSLKGKAEAALPNDGIFPANADHPEVVLHFSNADGSGFQVLYLAQEGEFSFDVPLKKYSKMFLCLTSGAAGPAPLKVTLIYQDGTTEVRDIVCPDWWNNLDDKNNPNKDIVYIAFNMDKWGRENRVHEKEHHHIFGIDVHPAPDKVLASIKVHKTRPVVCFWGATGVTAK